MYCRIIVCITLERTTYTAVEQLPLETDQLLFLVLTVIFMVAVPAGIEAGTVKE